MAMNRNMTMAEKEVRDYAQRQMERAEQRESIVFTEVSYWFILCTNLFFAWNMRL